MSNSITLQFTRDELVLLVSAIRSEVLHAQEATGEWATNLSCVHETKHAYDRACMLEDLTDRLAEFPR
jgi:hypothetical protein